MRHHLLVLAAVAALAGTGCAYFAPYTTLMDQPQARVNADLPVPDGFVLDTGASMSHERSDFRRLDLVFRRKEYLSEERVDEFVRRHYPGQGWQLDFIYGLEQRNYVFSRGAEECLVQVAEDFGGRSTSIRIVVEPRRTPEGQFVARGEPSASIATPGSAAPALPAEGRSK